MATIRCKVPRGDSDQVLKSARLATADALVVSIHLTDPGQPDLQGVVLRVELNRVPRMHDSILSLVFWATLKDVSPAAKAARFTLGTDVKCRIMFDPLIVDPIGSVEVTLA